MPVTPYAKLRASLNGGAPQTGGIGVVHDVLVQLSPESTQGWKLEATVYQITAFPPGWTAPSPWLYDPLQNFFYYTANGTNGVNPPAFTLPSVAQIVAGLWGKWKFRLLVNGGGGTRTDWSLALNLPDSTGLVDVAVSESIEFGGNLKWVAALQSNFRIIAAAIHGGVGGGVSLGTGPTTTVNASVPAAGSAITAPPYDHGHQVQTAAPSAIGTTLAAGSAATLVRSDHVHTLPWATVTSVFSGATTALSMNGQKITALGAPSAGSSDAATAAYAEGLIAVLGWKLVRGASLGDQPLTGALTEDGITYITGDRYLAKNQITQTQIGIYVVNTGGAWARAADFSTNAQAVPGMTVYVSEGTFQHDTGWSLTTNAPIAFGTTNLAFAQTFGLLTVDPTSSTPAFRGPAGELLASAFANDDLGNVAGTGIFRSSGDAQTVVAAKCVATPADDIVLIAVDGNDGIQIGDTQDTTNITLSTSGSGRVVAAPGSSFSVEIASSRLFLVDGGNFLVASAYNFRFFNDVVAPTIGQLTLGGTGATAGQPLVLHGQPGQQQAGGAANNNGGNITVRGGDAGTGGGGAAGLQGNAVMQGGGKMMTLSSTGLAINAAIDLGTHKLTSVVDPTNPQEASTKAYTDAGDTARALAARTITTTLPLTGGGDLTADRTLAINASSAATANYVVQRDGSGGAAIVALTVSSIGIPATASFSMGQNQPATGVSPNDWSFLGQSAHTGDAKNGAGFAWYVGAAGDSAHVNGTGTFDLGSANAANFSGRISLATGGTEFGSFFRFGATPSFGLAAVNDLAISIAGTTIFSSTGSVSTISRDVSFVAQGGGTLLRLDPTNSGKVAWFGGAGATQQTVSGTRLLGDTGLASLLAGLAAYNKIVDTTTVVSNATLIFELDVTLTGGSATQASGKTLTNALIVAVVLKTAVTATGQVKAVISGNNVVCTSFTALGAVAVTDASIYTVKIIGAV